MVWLPSSFWSQLLLMSPLLILPMWHFASWCPLTMWDMFQPWGICNGCSLCLDAFPPDSYMKNFSSFMCSHKLYFLKGAYPDYCVSNSSLSSTHLFDSQFSFPVFFHPFSIAPIVSYISSIIEFPFKIICIIYYLFPLYNIRYMRQGALLSWLQYFQCLEQCLAHKQYIFAERINK